MLGLVGTFTDVLFGGVPGAKPSGAFPGLGTLGSEYQQFLLERLRQPASETTSFRLGSEAIREALGRSSRTARQRLGETATARGFFDSGAVLGMATDIDRAEMEAFGSSLRELVLSLEDRRTAGVLPYLSAGAGEASAISGMNIGAATARRGQDIGFVTDIFRTLPQF